MRDESTAAPSYTDPVDAINAAGWRVVWVPDLDARALRIDKLKLVLADAAVDRGDLAQWWRNNELFIGENA